MPPIKIEVHSLLARIRSQRPIVHHLTNWVTIYDCANIVKVLGASPVMAHAKEEVAQMTALAGALVLNIGTLTPEFVEAMEIAALSANARGIPVILDACGAGATTLRTEACFTLLQAAKIGIIKGNASEIARLGGEDVQTRGVDAAPVAQDLLTLAQKLAQERQATVVITGVEDIVADGPRHYRVRNGHPLMAQVVGTGCMAASVIGAFAAVEPDLALASAAALVCFGLAAELAAASATGPGTFKEKLFDCLFHLDKETIDRKQRVAA
jgi:hydroxyethylthiazole kinase